MIKVTAPGRAGIIGNPTDGYGGTMIACSTRNRAHVLMEESDQLIIENSSGKIVLKWENDFVNQGDSFDIVRSVLRYFKLYNLKARIVVTTDIPAQAGLAGSTAVLSAVLSAITAFTGRRYHKYHLAELNRIIELHYMKCHCGYQDAYMTTFGGLNYLDFRGKEYYKDLDSEIYATVEPLSPYIALDEGQAPGAERIDSVSSLSSLADSTAHPVKLFESSDGLTPQLPFVVAHTGIKHHSGSFHKPLRERWLEGDREVMDAYTEIAHLAREGKKALLNGDWEQLAYLMNKNHELQDSLTDSGEQNNYMIRIAKEKGGALAAKLAGAGGGGTIIALTPDPGKTIKALKEVGADEFVELDPFGPGITMEYIDKDRKQIASTAE